MAITFAPPLTIANAARGIDAAVSCGAHVINASWGFDLPPSQLMPLLCALERASDAGVLVVVAAGNGGKNLDAWPEYPACCPLDNVLTVAGHWPSLAPPEDVLDTRRLVPTSNRGATSVHLAAPGDGIWTAVSGEERFADRSGTSFAAPFVAGAAALLHSLHPRWRAADLRAQLLVTARPSTTPSGQTHTDGWLDVERAVLRQ